MSDAKRAAVLLVALIIIFVVVVSCCCIILIAYAVAIFLASFGIYFSFSVFNVYDSDKGRINELVLILSMCNVAPPSPILLQ